jgi:uncharacterized protein YecT (DUF1311 family)
MTMKTIALLALALASSIAAAAPRACEKSDEPLACETEDNARADKALNLAYKEAMARLSTEGKTRLRTAQRAWIKARDAECDNLMGAARTINCQADWAITRTAELQRL